MNVFNSIVSWFFKQRNDQIRQFVEHPIETQERVFWNLIHAGRNTEWGVMHDYNHIDSISDFKQHVPLQDYDSLKPYIERLMKGEQHLLWPTEINWFAKSSGTTSDKSKFIPVSPEALDECHYKGGKDVMAVYLKNYPDAEIFTGKGLVMGGSNKVNQLTENSYYGDVSAVMLQNLPFIAEYFRTPELGIALMDEWEEKIERMARSTSQENVTHLAGAPTWTLVLIRRILEITGKQHIKEVWPNLQLFIHGGVSFTPYKQQYQQLIPGEMHYMETYNASEGFFGLQDEPEKEELLLMLDYGIFYEFLPLEEVNNETPKTLQLEEVEVGKNYALVISTNAGLWRYVIGDTIKFTSVFPFKFRISGRIKHFINVFGEEVIVDNADRAIAEASEALGCEVKEYTAAPFLNADGTGGHEWLIEFSKAPKDLGAFTLHLDEALKKANSDYEAKRHKSMVLHLPIIHAAPEGTFYEWLKARGKLGGQHKIPRLSNERTYLEEIMALVPK
ncbi:MAG: GH3 auxin-responsive promoter family protein [Chitinophagales bacterium]|nr:GH3 auxin-responsive promoter family protein [Chitinophagales bacterium]